MGGGGLYAFVHVCVLFFSVELYVHRNQVYYGWPSQLSHSPCAVHVPVVRFILSPI